MKISGMSVFTTDYGTGAIAATVKGVCQVWLPGQQLPDFCHMASDISTEAARQLECYFKGIHRQFDLLVDIPGLTAFRQLVLKLVMEIPFGTVITYRELAVRAGTPLAARAVGGALASNPVPVIIPCHRVVASSGALTGYSCFGGMELKRKLLGLEGVDFMDNKKVRIQAFMNRNFYAKK